MSTRVALLGERMRARSSAGNTHSSCERCGLTPLWEVALCPDHEAERQRHSCDAPTLILTSAHEQMSRCHLAELGCAGHTPCGTPELRKPHNLLSWRAPRTTVSFLRGLRGNGPASLSRLLSVPSSPSRPLILIRGPK